MNYFLIFYLSFFRNYIDTLYIMFRGHYSKENMKHQEEYKALNFFENYSMINCEKKTWKMKL